LQLCVLLACIWSSPLFVSIGSLISIPASIISDHYLHASLPSSYGWIGIAAIVASFIATLIPDNSIIGTHGITRSSCPCCRVHPIRHQLQ
jgi:drug/metabolite transporter (DMT)-like permease